MRPKPTGGHSSRPDSVRGAPPVERGADVAHHDPALGAQPQCHEVHPHARLSPASVCDRPLRIRRGDLRRADPVPGANAPRRASPPARARPRRGHALAEPALVRLRARPDDRLDDRAFPGAIPIFAALFGLALGTERPTPRFWLAALVSAVGVGLVAAGFGGGLASSLGGILLGLSTAATWAAYSVMVGPLMRPCSPSRMSAIVFPGAGSPSRSAGHADRGPGVGSRLGDLGAHGLRHDRPARAHQHPLVPLNPPDQCRPGDAGGKPAALRRGRACRHSPVGAPFLAPDRGRRADRARDSRRPASGTARPAA